MDWLQHHIWPAEQQWVSPAFVRDGTRLAIAEMLRGGTTCFNDMYFFPDQVAHVAIDSGIRASVGLIVIEFPSAWATDADDYLRKGLEVHDQLRGHDRVQTAFAPHAPYTVGDDALRRIVTYAGELNLPIAMHVHETAGEVARTVKETGERPLKRLERLGLLSPQFLAIHMTQLEAYEIATLAASGPKADSCRAVRRLRESSADSTRARRFLAWTGAFEGWRSCCSTSKFGSSVGDSGTVATRRSEA